jgi:predicted phosphodiesterase
MRSFVEADAETDRVIVFGHTHRPEACWREGRFYFNPGAASNPGVRKLKPSFGVLWYDLGGCVDGKNYFTGGGPVEPWALAEE